MKTRSIGIGLALIALLAGHAVAAPATCEARGMVVDQDGNPIPDVKLVFKPSGNPETSYDGTTNKKGRYYIPGMFNPSSEGMWVVEIEAEGYVATQMVVESRTVNRVLVGDVRTTKLKPGAAVPEVMIRGMGYAEIDFTLLPEDQVATPAEVAGAGEGGAAAIAAPAPPARDPWDSALSRASSGDLDGSVEFFEEAIEDEPDDPERFRAYAQVLYQLERHDEAEVQALRAVGLSGGDVESLMVLYTVYIGKDDLAKAREVLVEANTVAPDDPRVMQQLAYVAGESGDTQTAIEAYRGLTELDPMNSESWLALAGLCAEAGEMEESEAAYQKVVELDPNQAHQVFFNLGALIMNKSGRTDEDTSRAIDAFRRAIELKPDYGEAHKQLAFALLGTGDRSGAKSELEAYVKLAPDAPDSRQLQSLIDSLQ
jgi:Flp pilus assembly protein TadD